MMVGRIVVMNRKLLPALLAVLGVAIILVSALAEPLGLGSPGGKFGWKQILGIVVGALVVVGGMILWRVGPMTASPAVDRPGPGRTGDDNGPSSSSAA
jgi:hypothetical protein